jgi:hypothetical protein
MVLPCLKHWIEHIIAHRSQVQTTHVLEKATEVGIHVLQHVAEAILVARRFEHVEDLVRVHGGALEVVVVELGGVVTEVELAAVVVFPALFAPADPDHRVLGVALNEPLLLMLV